MDAQRLLITFPAVTGNHYKSVNFKSRRVYVTAEGKAYRNAVKLDIIKQRNGLQPICTPVEVEVIFYPPDKRRRDSDNLEKVLNDALTLAGLWTDDKLIKRKVVTMADPDGTARVEMMVKRYA